MSNINLTVGKLKELLKDLPDDMDVIIPICPDESKANIIDSFWHVRTAGVLKSDYAPGPALCLATSDDGKDVIALMRENKLDVWCDKLLF